jgi:hypothetical protein
MVTTKRRETAVEDKELHSALAEIATSLIEVQNEQKAATAALRADIAQLRKDIEASFETAGTELALCVREEIGPVSDKLSAGFRDVNAGIGRMSKQVDVLFRAVADLSNDFDGHTHNGPHGKVA